MTTPARPLAAVMPSWSAARWTGKLLDITGWTSEQIDGGVALITEVGSYGPGGRALYDPRPDDPGCWDWNGDIS